MMKLSVKEIAYISSAFTNLSPISLLANIKEKPDGSEYQSLVDKGIIQGGAYSKEALDMLTLLSSPERCSRLILQNDFCIIEKYTYRKGDRILLTENNNGEMLISEPVDMGQVIIGLSELTGMSKIKTANISIILQADEMLVFLAVTDIYRRNSLLTYAGREIPAAGLSAQDITDELANGFGNGLVKVLVNNYRYTKPPVEDLSQILANLVQKECLQMKDGYLLTDTYSLFAKNFLIPDGLLMFEAFETEPDGHVSVAGSVCITAGIHDVISFILDGNTIELSTLSASQMLATIEDFLLCPSLNDALKTPQTPPVVQAPLTVQAPPIVQTPPIVQASQAQSVPTQFVPVQSVPPIQASPVQVPASDKWFCRNCGKENKGNFCVSCGTKR